MRDTRGIITVFVTLIMVPVVVITSMMVDLARIKSYSSQAVMAADSYGEAILSEYDNLLKELYGLFSVTQNEEGLAAVEKMKDYAKNSFQPDLDGRGLTGFMPYKDADVELSYEKLQGASLSNNSVLMTQISDFMKYRIVEEVLGNDSPLETLSKFDSMDADMDAMDDRNDITDSSQEALEEIEDYYDMLKNINDYPGFIKIEEERFKDYSSKLTEIAAGADYEDYVFYLQNKDACDEALEKKERIENSDDEEEEELTEEEEEMADIAERVSDYGAAISSALTPLKENAENYTNTGKLTDYDAVLLQIRSLGVSAGKIKEKLTELKHQVESLKDGLDSCSQEVKEGIEEEIRDLDGILQHIDDFQETYDLIEPTNQDSEKSANNKLKMNQELLTLNNVFENLVSGNVQPGDSYWPATVSFQWYSFREHKDRFYLDLQQICEGGDSETDGDKRAGKKKQNEAEKMQQGAERELNQDDSSTEARDISGALAGQLKSSGASGGSVPDLLSYFSRGLSFDAAGMAGSQIIDRFLVTSYDFGMFSSRVSGIRPQEEGEADSGEVYADESLTGYKISEKINYLYGAELEYLLGGHNRSADNLNETKNIICGVRLTMNFASTYKIKEVHEAIKAIANAAAQAVAASGVGAAVAPLVRVAVSGALRAAIATMETAEDWKALKNREKTAFFKTEIGQLKSLDAVSGLLEGKISGSQADSGRGLKLGYEDYLYVLLCLMIDSDTLMCRTSNLITLNVNQAQNTADTLADLKFKMSDTVTAVKSTCKVKMDFVVLPDHFMDLYLEGTSTETMIQKLENEYFGYSIIRGY